jgi:hypothetical protein
MYSIGTALSQRSNADGATGWNSSQALTILYFIALNGEFVATDVLYPLEIMTAEEIIAACQRLEEEELNCYWCGVKLAFLQGSGFNLFTPDRLFDMQYYEVGQRTVRSCTHCQFLFRACSFTDRELMIDALLSRAYCPDLGDLALSLYEDGTTDDDARNQGICRSNDYSKYWAAKYDSQSEDNREKRAQANIRKSTGKIGGRTGRPDIRKWKDENECCEFARGMNNRCVVTGFGINIIKGIVMDRVWDDGEYCVDDVMLLWGPCNYAKAKVPFFNTKAAFLSYKSLKELDDLSHRKAAVLIVREPLERLRTFQREKRNTQ